MDKTVSGGTADGRDRMVQSRQLEHAPGFVQESKTLGFLARASEALGLCSTQPGHEQISPHPHSEGKDPPLRQTVVPAGGATSVEKGTLDGDGRGAAAVSRGRSSRVVRSYDTCSEWI